MVIICALLLVLWPCACIFVGAVEFEELTLPICPSQSESFTVTCRLPSDMSASTIWTIQDQDCSLPHHLSPDESSRPCGPGNLRMVEQNSQQNIYASQFSFIPTEDMDGLEMLCFSSFNDTLVYSGRVTIAGPPLPPAINSITEDNISRNHVDQSVTVVLSWEQDNGTSVSSYVVRVDPSTGQCPEGGCVTVLRRGDDDFSSRTLSLSLLEGNYMIHVRASSCDGALQGEWSEPIQLNLRVPDAVESCNATVTYNGSDILVAIQLSFRPLSEGRNISSDVPGLRKYVIKENDNNISLPIDDPRCSSESCSYEMDDITSGVERLSVRAENAVGQSESTGCIPQRIGFKNDLFRVDFDVENEVANCSYPSSWNDTECTIMAIGGTVINRSSSGDTIRLSGWGIDFTADLPYNANATDGQLTVVIEGTMHAAPPTGLSIANKATVGVVVSFVILAILVAILVAIILIVYEMKNRADQHRVEADGSNVDDVNEPDSVGTARQDAGRIDNDMNLRRRPVH